jgi:hypothetical protein
MTTTPRQMSRFDSNPPPLDLGEAGSPTEHFQASSDEGTQPIGPSSAYGRGISVRDSGAPNPGLTRTAASPELKSSEEGHGTDTSTAPLNEAGPSRIRIQDKIQDKLSPKKLTLSPRLEMGRSPRMQNSPRAGSKSLRT